jgi:hypothetical protein
MGEGYKEIILQWSFNLWYARGEKESKSEDNTDVCRELQKG